MQIKSTRAATWQTTCIGCKSTQICVDWSYALVCALCCADCEWELSWVCEWWDCVAPRRLWQLPHQHTLYKFAIKSSLGPIGFERHIFKRDAARRSWNVSLPCASWGQGVTSIGTHTHGNQMAKTERESACTMLIHFFYARRWWDCWHRRKVKFRTCWRCAPAGKWVMPPGGGQEETCLRFTCRLIGDFGRWQGGDFEITSCYVCDVIIGIKMLLSFCFFCQCVTFKTEVEWLKFMKLRWRIWDVRQ